MSRYWLAAACALLVARPCAAASFRVTSTLDAGEGTLRAAIIAANRSPGSSIRIALDADAPIVVDRALPSLEAAGTRLDGGGATLREGRGCERPGNRKGCDGLVVAGPGIVVRNLRVAGFTFDGVAVRGGTAGDVRIEDLQAIDNLDDGIGVSEGAGPVTVERCLLMGNGFRTKGKGLLVFHDSTATLRDSVVVANRDGITVSDASNATLERVIVAGNYDKGVGVSGATLTARVLQVLANGHHTEDTGAAVAAPNADGVRVGLAGKAELSDSRVAGSGDTGVVVLDTSTVTLRACSVERNRGRDLAVAPTARLRKR